MQEMMAKNAAMLYKNDFDDDEPEHVKGGGLGNELQELEDMDGGNSVGSNSYI